MNSSNCYQLAILETSDLHCNILGYDYYSDKRSDFFGLAKTASLIHKYRKLYPNSLLVDNGDLIQGNALADYLNHFKLINEETIHPIIKVMNELQYDIATVGNHDFNYGVDFLKTVTKQANFPFICSNIFYRNNNKEKKKGESLFPKTYIIEKQLTGTNTIKIGFLGIAPPQILIWDKHILNNSLYIEDIVESAKYAAKQLKQSGADIIVALAHSGIIPLKYLKNSENAVYKLSKIKEIDAIFSGHAHNIFPGGKIFNDLEKFNIDNKTGKINDKPVVMPGSLGSHLGVIILNLEKNKQNWKIKETFCELPNVQNVTENSKIVSLINLEHEQVLKYIRSEVGKTNLHLHSWFSTIENSLASQFIQKTAVEFAAEKLSATKWKNLPIICAFAPLNTGSHGASYINVPPGCLAIKDISNLYPYDNEIKVLLINKKQIIEWLEFSAQAFQQVDLNSTKEINILNPLFPSFNFDCIYGLTYEIDITKPIGKRIVNLKYLGKNLLAKQNFAIVTNNYRAAGGGNFPNLTKLKILIDSHYLYKNLVIEKVKKEKVIHFSLEPNWRLKKITTPSKQPIIYESSIDSIPYHAPYLTLLAKDLNTKRAKYRVDLTKF